MLCKRIFLNILLGFCGLSLATGAVALVIHRLDQKSPWQLVAIQEKTMGEGLPQHSLALLKKMNGAGVSRGQLVSFVKPGGKEPLVHRIERVITDNGDRLIVTKGDANPGVDTWLLTDKQILAIYAGHLPLAGAWFTFLQTQPGTVLLIIVPALLVIAIEVGRLYRSLSALQIERQTVSTSSA